MLFIQPTLRARNARHKEGVDESVITTYTRVNDATSKIIEIDPDVERAITIGRKIELAVVPLKEMFKLIIITTGLVHVD